MLGFVIRKIFKLKYMYLPNRSCQALRYLIFGKGGAACRIAERRLGGAMRSSALFAQFRDDLLASIASAVCDLDREVEYPQ